jgi:hypothetical protein
VDFVVFEVGRLVHAGSHEEGIARAAHSRLSAVSAGSIAVPALVF